MDMRLKRIWYRDDGIISQLVGSGTQFTTLEHAYSDGMGNWEPKIGPGVYECIRGTHGIHSCPSFDTFEIVGVSGHLGLLFHWGNWNEDSEGCILVGDKLAQASHNDYTADLVTNTRAAFARFMVAQSAARFFTLTVEA